MVAWHIGHCHVLTGFDCGGTKDEILFMKAVKLCLFSPK